MYLGILIDSNLSWKIHIEYIAIKISKTVGRIVKLRHFLPLHTLFHIYQSLISPYITYGLSVWGQAYKSYLNKILILQKHSICFMYFTKKNEHTIPLFINAKSLPLNFLYYKTVAEMMHHVSTASAPINIRQNRPFYSCVLSYLAMNASEAGVELALIQTSLLFSCKCQLVSIRTT